MSTEDTSRPPSNREARQAGPPPTPSSDAGVAPSVETNRDGADYIDVRSMIRQASTRVSVDQILRRGTKYVSLLSKSKIDELINQAIKNIVAKYRDQMALPGQQVLETESKQEFDELLQQYQNAVKAKSQLEGARQSLNEELEQLRVDLERQKTIADGKLDEEVSKMLIVGFKEFEAELDRIVAKVFEKRKLILENENDPEAQRELKEIEVRIHKIISTLVQNERARFIGPGGYSRDREIAILEKRIQKLMEQVAAMENALRQLAGQKIYSNTMLNTILRQLGLAIDDPHAEKKREMVKALLKENIDLRARIKEMEQRSSPDSRPTVVQPAA